jgi:drug/metabolite transporter (DMT)-like permease
VRRTYLELLLATVFWGFGFIASVWALGGMGPILNTALRFGIAVVFIDLIFRFRIFKNTRAMRYQFKEFTSLFWPGFFLFVTMVTQTWGLKYTSPTRSGFITVLYVMFVPLFETFFLKARIKPILAFCILIALAGTALICEVVTNQGINHEFLGAINLGDWLTLLCAIFVAGHILIVNQTLDRVDSAAKYHIYQCIWITILSLVATLFTEGFGALSSSVHWDLKVWAGLAHLGILSSGIAFLIQIRAQKTIAPTAFGLLVLLESPWALLFSVLLGMEALSLLQLTGAGLILFAATLESLSAFRPLEAKT